MTCQGRLPINLWWLRFPLASRPRVTLVRKIRGSLDTRTSDLCSTLECSIGLAGACQLLLGTSAAARQLRREARRGIHPSPSELLRRLARQVADVSMLHSVSSASLAQQVVIHGEVLKKGGAQVTMHVPWACVRSTRAVTRY